MTVDNELFHKLRKDLLNIDPVAFVEQHLTLDGKPFRLHGNGYKPFADIYRYIGIKALEPDAKPVILVKGRQVGGTTMAGALEMYFMGSGIFGVGDKPPIRIIHAFPQLELAAAYSKTKLNPMIMGSVAANEPNKKPGTKYKSVMQSLLDQTSDTNDSLHFKQFIGGNHIWVESTGLTGDRLRGRQLSLDTELPTPNGFVKLSDFKEGDQLFDEQGNICNVTKLHPINLSPESYRITFDDGTIVDACSEHLWLTYTKQDRISARKFNKGKSKYLRVPKVKTTKEIINTLKISNNIENNHSIPNCLPINYPEKKLILDPYLLGIWLGDGDQYGRIESADPEILNNFEHKLIPSSENNKGSFSKNGKSRSRSYRVKGLTTLLTKLELIKNTHNKIGDFYNKYIPNIYVKSSVNQRLALLQGLMDTDGCCYKDGRCEITQVRKELSYQIYDLILSLGIKATIIKDESWRYDKRYQDRYRIRFSTRLPVFRMQRKLERLKTGNKAIFMSTHRFISKIEPIESRPMRCITVDSPSHLFLITRNYIPTHNTADIIFFDEVQDTTGEAMGNSLKILTTAKYGKSGKGVQVYFGTPRRKGSDFNKMWQVSSQQYYHLGCEKCEKHFPLYTPGSDDWEKIWLHGFIVRCTHCGHDQDKRDAAERGKWVPTKPTTDDDCQMIGFHINQLYMPTFTKEDVTNEKPGIHPINTERVYQNEVLGEFFQGDASPITPEEIREHCGEVERKFRARINPGEEQIVVAGFDYGARADLDQLANPNKVKTIGQSYSTAVVLTAKGPNILSIEFATKFKRNDLESKKGIIDQIMRQYSIQLAVGDIGYSNDLSEVLHASYGDRYLVSRAHNRINGHVKFNNDAFPKEIIFERDHYIAEMYSLMKKGQVKFPFGDYEKIAWLIAHCASMEIKPSISRIGEPSIHYVKGSTPNDGFMALLNAYLAYKFLLTKGFTNNNPILQQQNFKDKNKPLVITGYVPRRL